MKTKTFFFLLLVATLAVATERARFTPAANSSIKISGTSTLHEWTMQGSTINGTIDIAPEVAEDPANADFWKREAPARVAVRIPVTEIKSDHARMNNIMLEAMKAKSFPEIRYELIAAEPKGGATIATKGALTIAGVTRDLEMDVTAIRQADGRFTLAGEAPIKMTDFGITPPVTMFGTLKTGDQVKVSFRWVVDRVE